MSKAPEIQLLTGKDLRAKMTLLTRHALASTLADATKDSPGIALESLRYGVRSAIAGMIPQVWTEAVYPYPTKSETYMTIWRDLSAMMKKGTLLGAMTTAGEIPGVAGYKELPKKNDNEDKPPTIEICRDVLLSTHRGKGIYPALVKERWKQLRAQYPSSPVVAATRQPAVQFWLLGNGFGKLDGEEYWQELKQSKLGASSLALLKDRIERFGWKYFRYSPQSQEDAGLALPAFTPMARAGGDAPVTPLS